MSTVSSNTTTPPWPTMPPAAGRTTAEVVDQLAQRDAERLLDQAAARDVAGELERQRAARPAHAVVGVEPRAAVEDDRDRGQGDHVVDHGRLAEQPGDRGQRRLGAHHAALALEAVEHRGLLAADVRAGAAPDVELERL